MKIVLLQPQFGLDESREYEAKEDGGGYIVISGSLTTKVLKENAKLV